jgi:hypothetical protein
MNHLDNRLFLLTGFISKTNLINNVESMFENCIYLTGEIDGTHLWKSTVNNWCSLNAFTKCNKLTNWRYIPNDWGGGGLIEP